MLPGNVDPRRPDKVQRYVSKTPTASGNNGQEDLTTDYMNILGMIFSMSGLMLKQKWCAWVALYCSFISFANGRVHEETKQILSSFMLSLSAIIMGYMQSPHPMTLAWFSSSNTNN